MGSYVPVKEMSVNESYVNCGHLQVVHFAAFGCTLYCLPIQMQNSSLRSSGIRRKQTKSDTEVSTFTFRFLSSALFIRFSCLTIFQLGI